MKKRSLSLLSLLLATVMLTGTLASCNGDGGKTETDSALESRSETETGTETTGNDSTDTQTERESQEATTEKAKDTETEKQTETETEEDTTPKLDLKNGDLIEYADRMANRVNAYYSDALHSSMILKNANMSLEYELRGEADQLISSLKNTKGVSYLEGTSDVFVRMKNGSTYYSSKTSTSTATNIYRLGYYYYDVRLENQDFVPAPEVISELALPLKAQTFKHLTKPKLKNGELIALVNGGNDPYFVFDADPFSAEKYPFLQLTLKVESKKTERVDVYFTSDEVSTHSDLNKLSFSLITDGEYHTYTVCLATTPGYTGSIDKLRIDFMGDEGTLYTINSAKLLEADISSVPDLRLGRFFQVYSDKLHHYAQFCATDTVTDIDAVGMLTQIPADRVEKLVIRDKNGLHDSLTGVDFDSAEYVGFDIKDTGIFGYIIPSDEYGGRLEVTLEGDVYSIIQTRTPNGNTIIPSKKGTNNANDFYMSQRLYTDASHDFARFLSEADAERHPLTAENIRVNAARSSAASFKGYDSLRGRYVFTMGGTDFNAAYYRSPNKHYNVTFTVTGDEYDRRAYFSTYTSAGALECAVLLDAKEMLLPVPVEVCKNFVGDGENNLYNLDEPSYGETYVPMIVNAGEERTYTVVNLYQNWGQYPLKQLSSIQYFYPYYHLSMGVTESNCIVPYATLGPSLPDHRAMSAPLWKDQPQHTLGGNHKFLNYTDADGNYAATQNQKNVISSHGPTYAELDMTYLSDDGRIKVTYTHAEMPQDDENRTYYLMEYEVLEDIRFNDLRNEFILYSVGQTGTGSTYKKVGYLNEQNASVIVDAMTGNDEASYVLGNKAPYFDFFYVPDYTNKNGYVNLAFMIRDYSLVIGGKESDARFIVTNKDNRLYLSLDLGETTLKAGDRIRMNCILMPWGSEESVYDGSNGKFPDQNVRDVRQYSILDPLKAEAVENCEVVESHYMPKLRTKDGKQATFTLSGGEGNVTSRIYGFDKLTVPVIEELVGGEWQEYVVSSACTPDALGNAHPYDGYMAHYDGDGSFSYSFVTTLKGDEARTFRISAEKDFEGWPEIEKPEVDLPTDVFCNPNELLIKLEGAKGVGKAALMTENDQSFVRIYGNAKDGEGNVLAYSADGAVESGPYVILKYRIPTTNQGKITCFEIFTSTINSRPDAADQLYCHSVKEDGFWHTVVIDMSKEGKATFTAKDGKYYANYLRLDFFSAVMSESSYIDIAYIGMSKSFEEILELNSDMNTVTLITNGSKETYFDVKSGEQVEESGDGKMPVIQYVDPSSGYTESTVKYAACIDMLNGWGIGEDPRFQNVGASSLKAPDVLDYGVSTVNGCQLILTGWVVAEGGIDRYVWSADGGKTWNNVKLSAGLPAIKDALDDYMASAASRLGGYEFVDYEASKANSIFQGTVGSGAKVNGIYADLSAYVGETVNLTFAAVPKSANDTLCILLHVKNVHVAEAE